MEDGNESTIHPLCAIIHAIFPSTNGIVCRTSEAANAKVRKRMCIATNAHRATQRKPKETTKDHKAGFQEGEETSTLDAPMQVHDRSKHQIWSAKDALPTRVRPGTEPLQNTPSARKAIRKMRLLITKLETSIRNSCRVEFENNPPTQLNQAS
jgi:hypothetical protein